MKKILLCFVSAFVVSSLLTSSASAFGGYSHWEIANRTVEYENISTSNNKALAYKTGSILADIGKSHWDAEYTVSDSWTFANKIMELDTISTAGPYFARGWYSHVYQDTYGDVSAIIADGGNYSANCGQIDEYLRDDLGLKCPINDSSMNIWIDFDLIRDTYSELDNFAPTNYEISDEIEALYTRYDALILLNFQSMNSEQITRMETQFDDLAQNCYHTSVPLSAASKSSGVSYNSYDELEVLFDSQRSNADKAKDIAEIEAQIDEVTHLQIISCDGNGSLVKYVVDDNEAYEKLLVEYVNIILEDINY